MKETHLDICEYKMSNVISNYSIQIYDDFLNRIVVTGWAFCPTFKDNSQKKIQLLLESDNFSYLVDAFIYNRIDVKHLYGDQTPFDNHGFSIQFSSVSLPEGIYNLYLIVRENEQSYGLKKIGVYANYNDEFIQYSLSNIPSGKINLEIKEDKILHTAEIKYDINVQKSDANNLLLITGWANVVDYDSSAVGVIVKCTLNDSEAYYQSVKVTRDDVAKIVSPLYQDSGYICKLPLGEFESNDIITIQLILQTKNGYAESKKHILKRIDENWVLQ